MTNMKNSKEGLELLKIRIFV